MPMNLKDEIVAGESYSLEFKRVPNEEREKYLKTVVAFANGKGGRILFGVANDRTMVGIPNERIFAEMDGIVNSISDACAPKIPVDVCVERVDGKSLIALDVFAGTRCPYYLKSQGEKDGVYIRVGATTQQADDATRHELALESEGRSFDKEPCLDAKISDKTIKALCAKMYKTARWNCKTDAERRKVKRVTEKQLEAWGIIKRVRDKWVGSNAYALLTGDAAQSIRIKCGVFKGDTKAVFVDRREFTGSICELIEQAHDYILAKINMGCHFKGVFRRDRYELPPDGLRELVINAFAHRNYFDHDAPIFVAVYDTRVEITSPGGLPRGLTAEKAISGCSKIRNKALAEALSYMRYVEGWGSGFLRVNEELADYGAHPVEIEDAGIATRLNVYRVAANAQSDRHEGNEGNRECNHEPNEPNRAPNDTNGGTNGTNGGTNGTNQIVECLRETPCISLDELAKRIGVSRRTIVRMIDRLKKQGCIRRKGGTRGVWEVL